MRRLVFAGAGAATCMVAAGSALALTAAGGATRAAAGPAPGELRAFQRPATAADALPHAAVKPLELRFGRALASRRIATSAGTRRVAVYLIKFKREHLCLVIRINARSVGAGCSQAFFSHRQIVASVGERMLWGLAANEVARVAFVDANGHSHGVRLTRDGGFIYQCQQDRCLRFVRAVDAYDRHGHRVTRIRL
jgi:hypothetical protein